MTARALAVVIAPTATRAAPVAASTGFHGGLVLPLSRSHRSPACRRYLWASNPVTRPCWHPAHVLPHQFFAVGRPHSWQTVPAACLCCVVLVPGGLVVFACLGQRTPPMAGLPAAIAGSRDLGGPAWT